MPLPQLHGYRLVAPLDQGGFGTVYQAYSLHDGRPVAVKVLDDAGDRDALRRFVREAVQLRHEIANPYIVDYIDHDMDHEPPFLVMEFCEGGSLHSWVAARHPWDEVAAALLNASVGLSALHAARGFHRDIKPANLLLASHGNGQLVVKLGDLGLARHPAADQSALTRSFGGTEGYIAPEVLGGQPYHAPADIYSLGVTGIELLSGGRDASRLELSSAPAKLQELLERMTLFNPQRRPTIADVATGLRDLFLPSPAHAQHPERSVVQLASQAAVGTSLAPLLLAGLIIGGIVYFASRE